MRNKLYIITALFFAVTSSHLADARYQPQFQRTDTVSQPERAVARALKRGQASWYSETDPGIRERTANNEVFNDRDLTCAMWDVPFNQRIKVTIVCSRWCSC
mgnify:CR=1 FL=1